MHTAHNPLKLHGIHQRHRVFLRIRQDLRRKHDRPQPGGGRASIVPVANDDPLAEDWSVPAVLIQLRDEQSSFLARDLLVRGSDVKDPLGETREYWVKSGCGLRYVPSSLRI